MYELTIFSRKPLKASSHRTGGAPLSIQIGDERITIYTNNQAYTDALIEAINGVTEARKADKVIAELASEGEAA